MSNGNVQKDTLRMMKLIFSAKAVTGFAFLALSVKWKYLMFYKSFLHHRNGDCPVQRQSPAHPMAEYTDNGDTG